MTIFIGANFYDLATINAGNTVVNQLVDVPAGTQDGDVLWLVACGLASYVSFGLSGSTDVGDFGSNWTGSSGPNGGSNTQFSKFGSDVYETAVHASSLTATLTRGGVSMTATEPVLCIATFRVPVTTGVTSEDQTGTGGFDPASTDLLGAGSQTTISFWSANSDTGGAAPSLATPPPEYTVDDSHTREGSSRDTGLWIMHESSPVGAEYPLRSGTWDDAASNMSQRAAPSDVDPPAASSAPQLGLRLLRIEQAELPYQLHTRMGNV